MLQHVKGIKKTTCRISLRGLAGIIMCRAAQIPVENACVLLDIACPSIIARYAALRRCAALEAEARSYQTCWVRCEVECDCAVIKKTPTFDTHGRRTGTWHQRIWIATRRGSVSFVMYVMKPAWVTVSEFGKPSPPPPESSDEIEPWLRTHCGNGVVVHRDGAHAYNEVVARMRAGRNHFSVLHPFRCPFLSET